MARSKKSPKAKSPSKKVVSSSQSVLKKTDRKKRKYKPQNFKYYLHKVMKQVHADELTIGKRGMITLNDFMIDVFERLAREASLLAKIDRTHVGKKFVTLTSRHVQTAVRFVLPGELAKHAVAEATKAVATYLHSKKN